MTETVGGVSYSVDVDLNQLMQLDSAVDKTTKDLSKKFAEADKAVSKAGKAMSDAGGDAKKLASDISSTVSSTTEAIAAYNKMSSSLQAQRDGIAQYIAKLKEQNETLGLSSAELAQYQAAKLGATEKDKQTVANLQSQIDAYKRNEDAIKKNQAALAATNAAQQENRQSVAALIQSLKEYEATIGMTTQELTLYKAAQKGATAEDLAAIKSQFALIDAKEKANATNMRLNKTSSAVIGGLGGIGRSAGQVGIQVSQLTGQIQGGTNAFIAISQQAADLGFVLGVPLLGAVVSLAAAVGFSLVNAFNAAKNAGKELPDELEKRLEEIKAGFESTDEVSRKAFAQVELGKLNSELDQITNRINTLKSAQQTYFNLAAKGNNGARLDYKRVGEEIADLEKKLQPLALLQEKVRLETLGVSQEWKSTGDETDKAATAAEKFVEQLTLSTVKLNEGEEAALRLSAATALGLTNAEKLPEEVERAIAAYVTARQEAEAEAEFRKAAFAEQKQALDDIEEERKQQHKNELERIRQEKEAKKEDERISKEVRFVGVSDQQAELTRLADQYVQQQLLLDQALERKFLSEQEYANRKLALEQQTQAQINEVNKTGFAALNARLEEAGFSMEQFGNQAVGSFAAVLGGAMSGKEAIRGLAQSILTTAIGALIKLAITSSAGQATAAATGAATAAALSTAYATPAALVSLASFGANAAPAALGISSTVALSQGLAAGGGRLYGGPVNGGKLYPFMEDGKPEALEMGGKTYLWTGGGNGSVISNKDMAQSGGATPVNVNVNVNNSSSASVDVQRRTGPDRSEIIDIVVADIRGRGPTLRAITSTTTASNKI